MSISPVISFYCLKENKNELFSFGLASGEFFLCEIIGVFGSVKVWYKFLRETIGV